mmetsp:Transcript_27875/g.89887  ORF Transcript_27875/g.89887 Transcript_27875/m.89887 type:complete len:201 (+) Transcript_27875:164-766(+)
MLQQFEASLQILLHAHLTRQRELGHDALGTRGTALDRSPQQLHGHLLAIPTLVREPDAGLQHVEQVAQAASVARLGCEQEVSNGLVAVARHPVATHVVEAQVVVRGRQVVLRGAAVPTQGLLQVALHAVTLHVAPTQQIHAHRAPGFSAHARPFHEAFHITLAGYHTLEAEEAVVAHGQRVARGGGLLRPLHRLQRRLQA